MFTIGILKNVICTFLLPLKVLFVLNNVFGGQALSAIPTLKPSFLEHHQSIIVIRSKSKIKSHININKFGFETQLKDKAKLQCGTKDHA